MGNDQFDGRPGCIHGSPSLRSSVTVGDGAQGEVTIRLDHRSVRKSAVTVFILAGVFLLALWLYSEISHFLFLIILAWLFAIALEPGIRALIKRGRSRGTGAAVMGGGAIVIGVVLAVVFGQLFFTQAGQFAQSVPALASTAIEWVNACILFRADKTPTSRPPRGRSQCGEQAREHSHPVAETSTIRRSVYKPKTSAAWIHTVKRPVQIRRRPPAAAEPTTLME